jgi:DNA modification methylase
VNTDEHPHKKPAQLIEALIQQSSQPGDIVLDPFAGSGTTCLAAKSLDRRFVGIELDATYHELAEMRSN